MSRRVVEQLTQSVTSRYRCVNCSLLIKYHRKHSVIRLAASSKELLQSWITPTPLTSEHLLCTECLTLLQDQANTITEGCLPLPSFGHKSVCLPCGKSILRATRMYPVPQKKMERYILGRHVLPHLISRLERVCCACWRSATREAKRNKQQDSNSLDLLNAESSEGVQPIHNLSIRAEIPLSFVMLPSEDTAISKNKGEVESVPTMSSLVTICVEEIKSEKSESFEGEEGENFSFDSNHEAIKSRPWTPSDAEQISTFQPEDNDIKKWLHEIDQLGDIRKWDDKERTSVMKLRLRGSAKEWCDHLEDHNMSWKEWKVTLNNAFRPIEYAERLERMMSRIKEENETVTKYYQEKLSLLKKCNIVGKDSVACIIRGLPFELRANAKACNCETPEHLYQGYLLTLENGSQRDSGT